MSRRFAKPVASLVSIFVAVMSSASAARAQNVEALAAQCSNSGATAAQCTELAITARSLQGHVGLMAGLGSEIPGSAGTLGRRLGTTPHIAGNFRVAFANVALPDLYDAGSDLPRRTTFVIPSLQAGVGVGLFDGFSVVPTVGGILSLDVFASASVLFLPSGEGFQRSGRGFTLGGRLGVFRESFTLPGVAVSVSHRSLGSIRLGDATGPWGSVELAPNVTSMRVTVGKDVVGVGVLAGAGRDWYGGRATIQVREAGGNVVSASDGDYSHARSVIFGGASLNFLILQVSSEVGWAHGFSAVPGQEGSAFDPTAGTFYGSLAFRLTF
jgi:hypothetical protein